MRAITYSRYVLALASGKVDGEIRSAYLEDMGKDEFGAPLLGTILTTAAKMVLEGKQTAAKAVKLVKEEYAACGLDEALGSYAQYEPFAQAVFDEITCGSERLERCKRLTAAVQSVDRIIKDGVCLSAVSALAAAWLVLQDLAYVKEITDYAAGIDGTAYGVEIFRNLAELVLAAPAAPQSGQTERS